MNEILITLFSCALLNNLVMSHLVGLDLQLVASQRMQAAWNTGATTLVSLCFLMPIARLLDVLILVPLQLEHFTVLVYVVTTVFIITALQQAFYYMFPQHKENFNSVVPLLLTNNL
ncbi:MAG: Rnf-Nqr domain containing protein, partial [Gammaproteobacteria bacterium]